MICINNKEKKFFAQDLKNQFVEGVVNDKNANGDNNTNSFIITYLKEYVKTKLSKDIVNEPFIRPSKEKMLIELVLRDIVVFIVRINSEKEISFLNKSLPRLQIAKEIFEFKSKINCIIKNEQFIEMPNSINFIIKLNGVSTGE